MLNLLCELLRMSACVPRQEFNKTQNTEVM